MKAYLGLISAVALTLAACGGEAPAPAAEPAAPAEAPAAEAPAAVEAAPASEAASASAPAAEAAAPAAGDCSVDITGDDAMKYNLSEITVKASCGQFTVNLEHVGTAPLAAMGHNVVIAKSADKNGIVGDSAANGGNVKEDDERVVAATKLIGGGEKTSVTFDTAKLEKGGAYEFFCSFPGHVGTMSGKVNVVD
ncbi:MAG: azurin [Neisseriaceae bacterium]|nr:azurin [Neisseriaceae bacterium]